MPRDRMARHRPAAAPRYPGTANLTQSRDTPADDAHVRIVTATETTSDAMTSRGRRSRMLTQEPTRLPALEQSPTTCKPTHHQVRKAPRATCSQGRHVGRLMVPLPGRAVIRARYTHLMQNVDTCQLEQCHGECLLVDPGMWATRQQESVAVDYHRDIGHTECTAGKS